MTDKSAVMQDPGSSDTRLRREIERSLHDGILQELVALAVKLQLARQAVGFDQAALLKLLDEIGDDVEEALNGVRTLSDRIYPSALATFGLAEALRGLAAASGAAVEIELEKLRRYPPEIEATVYFCCREALESTTTRSGHPTLRIWQEDDAVHFEIAPTGSNLQHIHDRVEAAGGQLLIAAEPDLGTRLSAVIPLS
jgi:signal transduction histidine kinase